MTPRTPGRSAVPSLTPLELEILIALGDRPRHGYGIIQDIEARVRGFGDLRSGTLYLALRRLERAGWVRSCATPAEEVGGDRRRKFVEITKAGRDVARKRLREMRRTLEAAEDRALVRRRGT